MFKRKKIYYLAIPLLFLGIMFFCISKSQVKTPHVPTTAYILENGYPVNENGQTYGPDLYESTGSLPDLQLAQGENNIIGYIYLETSPKSLKDALEYSNTKRTSTPLYLEDGQTIIGTFLYD